MHLYRTHNCNELREKNVSEAVRLSGWVHRKRDHGGLLFIDVRDHFGITQCVTDIESDVFKIVEPLRVESVVKITGELLKRSDETINNKPVFNYLLNNLSEKNIEYDYDDDDDDQDDDDQDND